MTNLENQMDIVRRISNLSLKDKLTENIRNTISTYVGLVNNEVGKPNGIPGKERVHRDGSCIITIG